MSSEPLRGKRALVTGGAVRLGKAIAIALAGAGADVCIQFHSSADAARATVEELRGRGVRAMGVQADLGLPGGVSDLFNEVEDEFGGLDLLVNNAAVFEQIPWNEITVETWDRYHAINLRAPFLCSQRAALLMQAGRGGSIVNIADVGGVQAWKGYAHYCPTKAGLIMLTRVLAKELAPAIRVNAVAPGAVAPPEWMTPAEIAHVNRNVPLGATGGPGDIADAVLFLATAPFITGQTLFVDGGRSA
ncbi:MAG: 3-oxoacyl-[acyl-carrier-protein] reductase FabG [Myxococcota bacterium]|nr:3-oxoacyl-[acyl-carrier-protein] reductase FabG [Myxococcota bacterium]